MKRIILFVLIFVGTLTISAQTQLGYVKTLGRPNQKGVALNGVSIRVRGGHNAVLSNDKGFFSMMMVGKKEGDAYALQQVQKQGYQLNDENMIGRRYAISSKVPLTIVMVSTKQLQADKQRIENNAYKTAEKNYQTQKALLEKRQQANQITIEIYRQEIQQLQNSFEKYQSLIDGLAEHYAHTDYDELEAKEREINLCIENGDLDKAEQLLQALDIGKRLAKIEQRIKAGQQLKEEALEDQRKIQKQQEKDAEYLYQLYTIALGRFDNKKARYYIETRAALDSTNVRWQIDAGEFLFEYLNLYDQAMSYFLHAESHADKESLEMAECWNDVGIVFLEKGKIQEAYIFFQKSLSLRERLVDKDSKEMAIAFNSLGVYMDLKKNYDASISYHTKSLMIRRHIYGDISKEVALSYFNISAVYAKMNNNDKAKQCLESALSISDTLKSYFPVSLLAQIYGLLGLIEIGESSMRYLHKALELNQRIYGDKNIRTAESHLLLGTHYINSISCDFRDFSLNKDTLSVSDWGKLKEGLAFGLKSLEIYKLLLPEGHEFILSTKEMIHNVALVYFIHGKQCFNKNCLSEMVLFYIKSMELLLELDLKNDYSLIITISSELSKYFLTQKKYDISISFSEVALKYQLLTKKYQDAIESIYDISLLYHDYILSQPNNKEIKEKYNHFKKEYEKYVK